jgi:tRNA pseudouridine-54 N-methylase
VTFYFNGCRIKRFYADEKRLARILAELFSISAKKTGTEVFPGIGVRRRTFRDLICDLARYHRVICLDRNSTRPSVQRLNGREVWVLGDQNGFGSDYKFIVEKASSTLVVSPYLLHGEHCISVIHNRIDQLVTRKP